MNFWVFIVDRVWRGEFLEMIMDYQWFKFGFEIEDDDVWNEVLKELKENKEFEIINFSLINIEVNVFGINKVAVFVKVLEKFGFMMENVMVMGDSLNDIVMIEKVGVGVVMGNVQDIVKEMVDWVIDVNMENGVVKVICYWVL